MDNKKRLGSGFAVCGLLGEVDVSFMVALIVIGSILLFFAVLLFSPVVFAGRYDGEVFYAKIHYLFLRITVAPPKPKEKPKPKKEKKPKPKPEPGQEKKPSRFKQLVKNKGGLWAFLKMVTEIVKIALGELRRMFSHVVIYRMAVSIRIGGGDAASIAEQYGKACAVAYPSFLALSKITKCRQSKVLVEPDFTAEQSTFSVDAKVGIRPWFVFAMAFSLLFKALRVYLRKPKKPVRPAAENQQASS